MKPNDTRQPAPSEEPDALGELIARIPAAAAALSRIPRVFEFLRRGLGDAAQIWDPDDQSDVTTKLLVAGVQLEVEALKARFDEIHTKYEVARAAERHWRPMLRAKASVVFRNDAGQVARMPADLVALVAQGGTFDGDVLERSKSVAFVREGKVISEIPKTLFVCLERLLQSYDVTTARGSKPQSRSSRGEAPQFPKDVDSTGKTRERRGRTTDGHA